MNKPPCDRHLSDWPACSVSLDNPVDQAFGYAGGMKQICEPATGGLNEIVVRSGQLFRIFPCLMIAWSTATGAVAAGPSVPDTIAQRAIACTACHGKEGRATSDGYYPRIAGKPAGYLHNQLMNFREGRRQYPLMTYMVDHLSDAYLLEIAGYFASLHLPYPPPQVIDVPRQFKKCSCLCRMPWQDVNGRCTIHSGFARIAARLSECAIRRLEERCPARCGAGLHGAGCRATERGRNQRGICLACVATCSGRSCAAVGCIGQAAHVMRQCPAITRSCP
jgi:cytochrome c553